MAKGGLSLGLHRTLRVVVVNKVAPDGERSQLFRPLITLEYLQWTPARRMSQLVQGEVGTNLLVKGQIGETSYSQSGKVG